MSAPTTEELTAILSSFGEPGAFGDPNTLDATEQLALLAAGTGIGAGDVGNIEKFRSLDFSPAEQAISQDIFGRDVFAPTSVVAPGGTPVPVLPPAAAPTPPLAGAFGTAGELNIPAGAEFFGPTLAALTNVLGIQEGGRQFDVAQVLRQSQFGEATRQFDQSALANAAQVLANLRAQGPASAAELAFLQGGVFPGGQNTGVQIADLIGASTRGAGGTLGLGTNDTAAQAFQRLVGGLTGGTGAPVPGGTAGGATTGFGAADITTPNTLSGSQLSQLQANPNLAGVIGSFATASGNPDIFRRSVEALLPAGFAGSGSGF